MTKILIFKKSCHMESGGDVEIFNFENRFKRCHYNK